MVTLSDVDRTIGMYPVRDGLARALFLLRSRDEIPSDHHDSAAERRLLVDQLGDLDWEVPRLLTELDLADDLYLDSISQVVMDTWSRGRVTLVGDAGYSPGAAVGSGTSLAAIGGYSWPPSWPKPEENRRRESAATSAPWLAPSTSPEKSDRPS